MPKRKHQEVTLTVRERSYLPLYLRLRAIKAECDGVWASFGITVVEQKVLETITGDHHFLTTKQFRTLQQIEEKIFGDKELDA